jgi:hypothetical protein
MSIRALLEVLTAQGVRFSVIGGVALIARGVQRSTQDLDVSYSRDRENIVRLATALAPIHPRLRGVPPELPFTLDAASIRAGLNFTLDTDLGPLDLLGEVTGLGGFGEVDAASDEIEIDGMMLLVLTLDGLERAKRASGRPKDLIDLSFIQALRRR